MAYKILAFKLGEIRVHDYGDEIVLFQGQYHDAVGIRVNVKELSKKLRRHIKRKRNAR